jgi:hypothetical protein
VTAGGEGPVAFVHIPRTGGGTVATAITYNYARLKSGGNFQRSPEKTANSLERLATNLTQSGIRAVGDHVPLGLYRRYLPANSRYLTFLRDPVDRVLSHYYLHAIPEDTWIRRIWPRLEALDRHERERRPGEPFAAMPEVESLPASVDVSLKAGLARRIPIYDNFATRFLWGGESLFGDLPSDALERAKENLASFAFVGITERLDESIVLLGRWLGVGLMPYRPRHIRADRPPLADTAESLRALIEEHNALDIELYQFARQRFERARAEAADVERDVAELRRLTAEQLPAREAAFADNRARRNERRAVADARRAEKPLVFVHVPRTGGESVRQALAAGYARPKSAGNVLVDPAGSEAKLQAIATRMESRGPRVVEGHAPLGLFRRHLPPETRYVTLLRDPVESVLSHHRASAHGRKIRRGSLEAWLAQRPAEDDNLATRFLWGGDSVLGELPPDALERAKENLAGFTFVGLTDYLDESIIVLGRLLGIDVIPDDRKDTTQDRPANGEASLELRALIEERNALDVELYRFAREQFKRTAAEVGDFDLDAIDLRRRPAAETPAAADATPRKQGKSRDKAARRASRASTK